MTGRRSPVWIHDLAGVRVAAIGDGLVELWHDERLDQSERLELTVATTHPKASHLVEDVEVVLDDRRFRIAEVIDRRDGPETYRTATAYGLWIELADSQVPGSFELATTAYAGLTAILDGSSWTVGAATLDDDATIYGMEQTDQTRLALLRAWAKVTGRHIVWNTSTRTVDLVTDRGRELPVAYRYRRNLVGHTRRRRPPEATVVLPYGADDLTIAGLNGGNPELSDFTYYTDRGLTLAEAQATRTRRRVIVDPTFVRDDNLLAAAQRWLADLATERVSYELDVLDLSDTTPIEDTVRAGDTVRVVDPDLDVDLRTIVVRRYRDLLDPTRNQVELATLDDAVDDPAASTGRPPAGVAWEQFVGPIGATFQIRNDATFTVARLPLRFRTGGRANYHVDLELVGVGSGIATVTVADAEDSLATVHRPVTVAYSDGGVYRVAMTWAAEDQLGPVDYRLRVTVAATGGPSTTNGVNIAADADDVASFYVLAQGAVRETPTLANSVTFTPNGDNANTGAVQTWTVPDNVTEVVIEAHGGPGGQWQSGNPNATASAGAKVSGRFAVTPGETLEIYVGKWGANSGGWPDGGVGGTGSSSDNGGGGGGSTSVRRAGATFRDSLVVAAGGGGGGGPGFVNGGDGGWTTGGNGVGTGGTGATQYAPGGNGSDRTGGTGGTVSGDGQGGGGGGWYGGGGGTGLSSGGGGGSSWLNLTTGILEEAVDGGATLSTSPQWGGQVVISWEDPLEDV